MKGTRQVSKWWTNQSVEDTAIEIERLIESGATNAKIAEQFGICSETVKNFKKEYMGYIPNLAPGTSLATHNNAKRDRAEAKREAEIDSLNRLFSRYVIGANPAALSRYSF